MIQVKFAVKRPTANDSIIEFSGTPFKLPSGDQDVNTFLYDPFLMLSTKGTAEEGKGKRKRQWKEEVRDLVQE